MKKTAAAILALLLALSLLAGCGRDQNGKTGPEEEKRALIEEMLVDRAGYGDASGERVDELLARLRKLDGDAAGRWEKIIALWKEQEKAEVTHYGVLPDGLPQTGELCLVVLGFQLNADGTMKDELIERLKVAKASAEKYPNAPVVCTGGGTAKDDPSATEAGRMAEWLIKEGIDESRIVVEDKSLTTAQNAIYTFDALAEKYPDVRQIAVISSDYHIATGTLLFGAEAILRGEETEVVSHAAWKAPSGELSAMFQAGALIELSGDVETAFDIYYDNYDIHELPPLN